VREAITLERLEYCILLDEDGNKRFVRGPAVVFPRQHGVFVERGGARKFRAIELNENSGIYVKVIAPYEEDGRSYKVGDELFLTGRDQMIYFPRPEHAVVKYSDQEIHYAIAIPAGEGRYVLDRNTGTITLKRGPAIYLPDPRREVIVRRVLDERHVRCGSPATTEAVAVNQRLSEIQRRSGSGEHLEERSARNAPAAAPAPANMGGAKATFAGDDFQRKPTYSPPRQLVLDTKYEGAVAVSVWTGYAVMVVNRTGERRVIVGPAHAPPGVRREPAGAGAQHGHPQERREPVPHGVPPGAAQQGERRGAGRDPGPLPGEALALVPGGFRGRPQPLVQRRELREVPHRPPALAAAPRGEAARRRGLLRPLGDRGARRDPRRAGRDGKRPGRAFDENGMRVYDVEVLDVTLGDESIASLLTEAQHAAVRQALAVSGERRKLELTREVESTRQQVLTLQNTSRLTEAELRLKELSAQVSVQRAEAKNESDVRAQKQTALRDEQPLVDAVHAAELARARAAAEQEQGLARAQLDQRLRWSEAEVKAVVEKAQAVSPDLVAALQAFSDRALAERMAESMAPLAILGGESVAAVLARLLEGTPLAKALPTGAPKKG
jgi:major vault protein